MKSTKTLRITNLLLAIIMTIMLSACAAKNAADKTDVSAAIDTTKEIQIAIPSHPSWMYNENWPAWKYIREATKANLKITAIPEAEYGTKIMLMFADKSSLPDLMFFDHKPALDQFASEGALIAIDDYLDEMPNYVNFWNSIPEDEREGRLMLRRSADGKTYFPQNYGTDSRQNVKAWLYRKDIFEKHGLTIPETMDELYETAVRLKELYPESYPICLRQGFTNFNLIGAQWESGFMPGLYYNFKEKVWRYGAVEETMKDMVEYLRKAYTARLLPPDYLAINTKSWEELISTDRGFLLADYVVRVDTFNTTNRASNPDYTLAAMVPPRANVEGGQNLVNKFNVDPMGYAICNTGDAERILNAVRFIDWFYSDEAAELTGWGAEGETYEIVNGKKQYIRPEEGDIQGKYGLFSYGTYLRVDPDAAIAVASEEQQKSVILAMENTEQNYNPFYWLPFTNENEKRRIELLDPVQTYTQEMLSKFLYNLLPMSSWDEFVSELKDMGIDELLAMYEETYSRVTEG